MPRLSIIIPSLGNTSGWENSLASVLQNRPEDSELLAVTHGPYSDPYALAGEVRFIEANSNQGWTDCVNLAVKASSGAILHLLTSGMEVSDGWANAAISHFANPRVAMVSPLIVNPRNSNQLESAGIRCGLGGSRRIAKDPRQSIGPSTLAGFYRAQAVELAGGFASDVGDQLADLDMALSLRQADWQNVVEPASRVMRTSVQRTHASAYSQGLHAERLFWRHTSHTGWANRLFHPLAAMAEVAAVITPWGMAAQLAGRAVACCNRGEYARHRQHLQEIPAPMSVIAGSSARFAQLRIDGPHSAHSSSATSKTQRAA